MTLGHQRVEGRCSHWKEDQNELEKSGEAVLEIWDSGELGET